MKVLVTGAAGQLGHDVVNELAKRGHTPIASDIAKTYSGADDGTAVTTARYIPIDLVDYDEVYARVIFEQPDAIIHCAAWTDVDGAENPDVKHRVRGVNFVGTKNVSRLCHELDIPMMYISTDYVFDGQGEEPWKPDCTDFRPLNYYGETKYHGEKTVRTYVEKKFFIVRIAWVFGTNGKNFIKTMLNVGKNQDTLKVVNDQIGTPTYTFDLARLLVDMIETDKYGYYHATNEGGYISWYDFAKEIFKQAVALGHTEFAEDKVTVIPVTTEEYGVSVAARPFNSRLDKSKLVEMGFEPLPDWKDAVARYVKELDF